MADQVEATLHRRTTRRSRVSVYGASTGLIHLAEAVSRDELLERIRAGVAIVVDLRPADEYEAGHIAGALSIPLPELDARLAELPAHLEIVAYCRKPYCAMSPEGVAPRERHGRRARRP